MKRGISLYSYQELYYRGELDLEGCVANAAATGATGIEILVDQMIPGISESALQPVRCVC